jgi:GT2 family glycosyltransferase
MTDIVVTSYFRKDYTKECLKQLHKNTTSPHRVIIVDNGSDNETVEELCEHKRKGLIDILVLLNKNYGLEPAKNMGLSFVRTERYVDCDNDIIVPPPKPKGDWLSELHELMDRYPKYGAISAHPHIFVGDNIDFLLTDTNEIREYSKCGASARLMRTDIVKKVGGWREEGDMKTLNRGEEFYIAGKIHTEGFKVGYARDVEVFHLMGDNWGYPEEVDHSHAPIWPPISHIAYGNYDEWKKTRVA